MMKLLELRARIRVLYQRYQLFIDPAAKFLLTFIMFRMLNSALGYDERFAKISIEILLALLCAFTPASIALMLAIVLSVVHVYALSAVLAIMVLLIFLVLYCFLFRFAPQYGYAAVAIPLLYMVKMPFAIPIYFGLMGNPITVLPAACGVVAHYVFSAIEEEAPQLGEVKLEEALEIYTRIIDKLVGNKQMILAVTIFALIITVVYIIRSLKIEYAFEISIAAGAVTSILGFLIGYLKLGISSEIGSMILGTILSAIAVLVLLFMKRVLDYTASENVQFEDDDYYYYVKAVPKIDVSIPKIRVKRINSKAEKHEEEGYGDEDTEEDDREDREAKSRE